MRRRNCRITLYVDVTVGLLTLYVDVTIVIVFTCLASSIEPRCILTIVNGLTRIDQTEVLVRGNETWREIIEQNIGKVGILV